MSRSADLPCRKEDADLWFSTKKADIARAQALCGRCPIRASCLEDALEFEKLQAQPLDGIHGGFTKQQRQKIRSHSAA